MTRDTAPGAIVRVHVLLVAWRIRATTIVSVILGLSMTYLTHTLEIFVDIGSGEYHLLGAAKRRFYLASYTFKIIAIAAVLIIRGTTRVAGGTTVNMMIFGVGNRP